MKEQHSFETTRSSQYDDDRRTLHQLDDSSSTEHSQSDVPPAYEEIFSNDNSFAENDGRVQVDLNSRLSRALQTIIPDVSDSKVPQSPPDYETLDGVARAASSLVLNIVIQIVGSRGDVQPFIALGNELQKSGHRVRIATHDIFKDFVTESNLEFYPIGGNPNELMAYMVKNPGLIPNMKTLRGGEVSRKRKMIAEMLEGCWESCIRPDKITQAPFVADAIIANPPSFAHVHCAQALGIPLHLMFTMPWTATKAFPHPLANIKNPKVDPGVTNHLSYAIVEWMTWQGLGDVINAWRETINLEPVPMTEGPFLPYSLSIPTTYCWSGALVPRPSDWEPHIDVCGFFFRDAPDYKPPEDLQNFIDAGPTPIYIGFGSIVIDDPEELTATLLEAVRITGVRCILSKGWSNLGSNSAAKDVFLLGDCPHEWLFQNVTAVIHHGGAGTTACGLRYGRPTAVVPFFGDQPFWGEMIAAAGAGPNPIPHKALNVDNLAHAITYLQTSQAARAAHDIAQRISAENGVENAANSFHRNLPVQAMPCDILPNQPAVWTYKTSKRTVKLSKLAAEILIGHLKIDGKKLGLNETRGYIIENKRWDPITGAASAALGMYYDTALSFKSYGNKKDGSKKNTEEAQTSDPGEGPSRADTGSSKNSSKSSSGLNNAGMNVAKASGNFMKGSFIDVPYAFAEGWRRAPGMYGEKIREQDTITDWKSGGVAAGKSFAFGIYDGISGLVMDPIRGQREEGGAGLVKGIGRGLAGAYIKPLGAVTGLLAYPLQGIYKSVFSAIHTRTRKDIAEARREEGAWMLKDARARGTVDNESVLEAFKELSKKKETKV